MQPKLSVADFNKDNKTDVLVTSNNPGGIAILLGNGDGTLQNPSYFATEQYFRHLALTDLNRDTNVDVVTTGTNYSNSAICILLGTGDGKIGRTGIFCFPRAASWTEQIGCADFNNDSIPDIVSSNAATSSVDLFLGNTNGTLQTPKSLSTGVANTKIKIADFNQDGRPDIVVAYYASFSGVSITLSVLLNNGDSTFSISFLLDRFTYIREIGVADINSDNIADIIL